MKHQTKSAAPFGAALIAAMGFIFWGCAANNYFIGAQVAPKHRIELKEGSPHDGVFKTADITLSYQYSKAPARLQINGSLEYALHLSNTYRSMLYFYLHIYFLDSTDKILGRQILVQASELDGFENQTVTKHFTPPHGTVALAFGYRGKTQGDASLGEGQNIWRSPAM